MAGIEPASASAVQPCTVGCGKNWEFIAGFSVKYLNLALRQFGCSRFSCRGKSYTLFNFSLCTDLSNSNSNSAKEVDGLLSDEIQRDVGGRESGS